MQQLDCLANTADEVLAVNRNQLSIRLLNNFISPVEADELLQHLIDGTSWQQPRIKVYGKWHPTPRLVSFHGDDNLSYGYSETLHGTQPWTVKLLELKNRLMKQYALAFNSVLLNYYRDGQDTMGWHADDEKELGHQPTIASLSLGAARDIHFKRKSRIGELIKLNLNSGSLLIMQGDTQNHWLHHIPKRARCGSPRVNLTFRHLIKAV